MVTFGRRAHLPAPAPGHRAGGPRRQARPRHASADLVAADIRWIAALLSVRRRGVLPRRGDRVVPAWRVLVRCSAGWLRDLTVSGEDRGGAEAHARALARAGHALAPDKGWRGSRRSAVRAGRATRSSCWGWSAAIRDTPRGLRPLPLTLESPCGADLQGFLRALSPAASPLRGGCGRRSTSIRRVSFSQALQVDRAARVTEILLGCERTLSEWRSRASRSGNDELADRAVDRGRAAARR